MKEGVYLDTKDLKVNSIEIDHSDLNQSGDKKPQILSSLKEIIIYMIIFVMCVFILPKYVVQKTIVDGDSMETTLHDKDRLLLDKLSYQFKNPDRFDIIVFYPYGKEVDEYYVKRVIALPGETVQIIEEDIFINGNKLVEHYGKDPITYAGIAQDSITLDEDEFFLLGDNREISLDSRYEDVGLVHRDMIAGRAILRILPLDKFGIVK